MVNKGGYQKSAKNKTQNNTSEINEIRKHKQVKYELCRMI